MATIIKRDSGYQSTSTTESVRAVGFDMHSFEGQANLYLDDIRNSAVEIVQRAKAEAAEIRLRAEEAGRAAAEKAIHELLDEKVASQIRTLRPALEKVAQQLNDARGQWLDHWHKTGVQVAKQIAQRVLRREIADDINVPLELVRESLELAAGSGEVTIRLSPHDVENLRSSVEQIVESLSTIAKARVIGDDSVGKGGCVVETQFGVIDQRITTQLDRIEEELTA